MEMMVEEEQAIFKDAGQAVHVAFLVMAQEAMQDAPFRKALIRVMESINLDRGQTHWLDQLRGDKGGSVNFAGLSGNDVRAQCAMITQAVVTNLPPLEKWVLQAKYGETEFEDIVSDSEDAVIALDSAISEVRVLREGVMKARIELDVIASARGNSKGYQEARATVRDLCDELYAAESRAQAAKVAFDQGKAYRVLDNGRAAVVAGVARRRFAFSPERITAIHGLSEYFAPLFPRLKPLALDFMLGRMFANHKKIDISARDLAERFGGNHTLYIRAAFKIKNHVRLLEEMAYERLTPVFVDHKVISEPN
jgi:hypothetical protein